MFRPTTFIGLLALGVAGIMFADLLIHPAGTKAAANGIVAIATPAESALLGTPPK